MPVYDYKCPEHGVFNELASMEQAAAPSICPQCKALSPRILMIPPEVLAMSPAKQEQRKAMDHNEQAKHSPIISTIDSRAEAADRMAFQKKQHKHSSRCGCSHETAGDRSKLKQQVILMPDGSKIFPSQRPWMISH